GWCSALGGGSAVASWGGIGGVFRDPPEKVGVATGLIIELRAVSKLYAPRAGGRAVQALTDVSFQVAPGDLVVLAGPPGAGKSTGRRLLAGEERPTQGAVIVHDEDVGGLGRRGVARLRRRLGLMPQDGRLLAERTALDNVAVVLRALGASRRAARARAQALLREVGLGGAPPAGPAELAAGERQRLLLARALAGEPAVLLADEPLVAVGGALDGPAADGVVALLRAIRSRGVTVLVASQAVGLAAALGGRSLRIEGGRLAHDANEPAHGASEPSNGAH